MAAVIDQSEFHARDGSGALIEPHTCIFPIMKPVAGGAKIVGTGFFVTMLGHFATAKHVVLDVIDPKTGAQNGTLFAAHFVEGASVLIRNITKVSYHNHSDIAIGKMDFHVMKDSGKPLVNRVPTFTTTPPAVGSKVVTYAYPESDALFIPGESAGFRPMYYGGELIEHSEAPRDSVMVSWPHYATSINVLGGASGGPVFNDKGRVFAVNVVGGYEDLSYMARVAELADLDVPDFPPPAVGQPAPRTVRDLVAAGHMLFKP